MQFCWGFLTRCQNRLADWGGFCDVLVRGAALWGWAVTRALGLHAQRLGRGARRTVGRGGEKAEGTDFACGMTVGVAFAAADDYEPLPRCGGCKAGIG